MWIVPKLPDGDVAWERVVETSSMKEYVRERNQSIKNYYDREYGEDRGSAIPYVALVENHVDYRDGRGNLIETYYQCEINSRRLLDNAN